MEPMLPAPAPSDPIWALAVAIIYFGSFITLGFVAKRVLDKTMRRSGETLEEIHAQAGPNRGKRTVFLLGVWRSED
jgi:hypothetical protein